jgi:hypothetical protein
MTIPMRRLGGALTITLLSITLVACGGSTPSAAVSVGPLTEATPAPASVEPDESPAESAEATAGASMGTTGRIEVAQHGFALTLPDGWTRVDLSQGDLEAIMAAAGEVDPALAEQYAGQIQALMAAGLAIFAFGPDPAMGTNLTVLSIPGAGLSLDLLDQINRAQLENMSEGDIESERITLPAGDAIHYQYALAEGTAEATLDQYFVLAGSKQLVVTATNATEADAAAIANSIEVLD